MLLSSLFLFSDANILSSITLLFSILSLSPSLYLLFCFSLSLPLSLSLSSILFLTLSLSLSFFCTLFLFVFFYFAQSPSNNLSVCFHFPILTYLHKLTIWLCVLFRTYVQVRNLNLISIKYHMEILRRNLFCTICLLFLSIDKNIKTWKYRNI